MLKHRKIPTGNGIGVLHTPGGAWLAPALLLGEGLFRFEKHGVLDVSIHNGDAKYLKPFLHRCCPFYDRNFKQLVFTQGGPSDIAYNNCKETLKLFDEADIRCEYHDVTGGHSWETWRQNLHALAQRLFK